MTSREPEADQQTELLAYAKRQTQAVESLRAIALFWSIVTALAAIVWLVNAMQAG